MDHGDAICQKLGITPAELNSLFAVEPVINNRGGDPAPSGRATAADLREWFGIPEGESLGDGLETAGVLTLEEVAWLNEG